ncbi:hypothetical protein [Rhodopila sp.]|uniref:hypothetical protein n=1 Tax=Rhodopila sp. TaxID=2480087 RepID=UPI003D1000CB
MRAFIGIALGSLLMTTGCNPPPPPVMLWSKPQGTYDQYLKDRYACIQDARTNVSRAFVSNGFGSGASGQIISRGVLVSCLAARGYVQSPTGFGPPPGAAVSTD